MRAVVDPNVLVSALISPGGPPRQIVQAWADERFELIVSPALVAELREVLARDKFRRWVSAEAAADFVDGLEEAAVVIRAPPLQPGTSPDPGDDYLIALTREGAADCLVSGDRHLTALGLSSTGAHAAPVPRPAGPRQQLTACPTSSATTDPGFSSLHQPRPANHTTRRTGPDSGWNELDPAPRPFSTWARGGSRSDGHPTRRLPSPHGQRRTDRRGWSPAPRSGAGGPRVPVRNASRPRRASTTGAGLFDEPDPVRHRRAVIEPPPRLRELGHLGVLGVLLVVLRGRPGEPTYVWGYEPGWRLENLCDCGEPWAYEVRVARECAPQCAACR